MADDEQKPRWELRVEAARTLADNGWRAEDIAHLLGWKPSTVEKYTAPEKCLPSQETRRVWDMGFELGVRAERAVAALDASSVDEVSSRLSELESMDGVGKKTVAEVKDAIVRIKAR